METRDAMMATEAPWEPCRLAHVLHIPRSRLEEYVLNRIVNDHEGAEIEEHLLWCEHCLDYVELMERFLESLRAGNKLGGFDVELMSEEFKTWRTRMNKE